MTLDATSLDYVCTLVRRDSGIVLTQDKGYLIESRLLPLARQAGTDVATYVKRVQSAGLPGQRSAVVEALTTNETSFFRDGRPFTTLTQTIVPELLSGNQNRRISVWSAACSSGQEAYSIAMAIRNDPKLANTNLQILATDLSKQMVQRATAGFYTQLEVNRGLPASHLVKYLARDGAGWRISPALQHNATFRELNLTTAFPPGMRFDIVFLRNVLIYFDQPTKAQVLRQLRNVLAPDGYLVLGTAETTAGAEADWIRTDPTGQPVYRLRRDARP